MTDLRQRKSKGCDILHTQNYTKKTPGLFARHKSLPKTTRRRKDFTVETLIYATYFAHIKHNQNNLKPTQENSTDIGAGFYNSDINYLECPTFWQI